MYSWRFDMKKLFLYYALVFNLFCAGTGEYDLVINDIYQLFDPIDLNDVKSIKIEKLKINIGVFNSLCDKVFDYFDEQGIEKICFYKNKFTFNQCSNIEEDDFSYIRFGYIEKEIAFINNENFTESIFDHVLYGIDEYGQFDYGQECVVKLFNNSLLCCDESSFVLPDCFCIRNIVMVGNKKIKSL